MPIRSYLSFRSEYLSRYLFITVNAIWYVNCQPAINLNPARIYDETKFSAEAHRHLDCDLHFVQMGSALGGGSSWLRLVKYTDVLFMDCTGRI